MQKEQNTNLLRLLFSRQFYPLFWVQFLGAFNDNLFKNALVMLITFKLSQSAEETGLLITLAAGLFILPFFIFSSLAGQLADRYAKSALVRKVKLAELLIMAVGAMALIQMEIELLLFTLFLMGSQSAFFGPIKYSLLPELLKDQALIKGNSLFSGSTFIAILLGTILGGLGVLLDGGLEIMAGSIIAVAAIGYLFSLKIVQTSAAEPNLKVEPNIFVSTWRMVASSKQYPVALLAIVSISWFWFIGATLLSQIPALVKYDLFGNDQVVMLFLTLFSVGIAIGSVLVGKVMKGGVHLKWHWIMLTIMSVLLWLTVWSIEFALQTDQLVSRETLYGVGELISVWPVNLTFMLMALLAIVGGAYIVPLYTLLQINTPFSVRARMIAVNNIVNALLMVLSAILIMIGFSASMSLLDMLTILAIFNLLVAARLFKSRKITS